MHCPQKLVHTVRQGDNLYQLARYYETTVQMIMSMNPGIDPYNLQIGSSVLVCPGESFVMRFNHAQDQEEDAAKQLALTNAMRLVWQQHVYWTRMLLISIAERLADQSAVTNRLLQNPSDIADIFARFYSPAVAKTIARLLTEHLQIGGELITALRDGRTAEADRLNREWYMNADKMAEAFASINPYYRREDVRKMLYKHLELTTQEVALRLARKYPQDIEAFNKVEQEALMMADYFSSGIMQQFPQKFR